MLDSYGVLWYWEGYINALFDGDFIFDKLISIRKTPHCYIGYFTVNDPDFYGQIIVRFGKRSFKSSEPIIRPRDGPLLMKYVYEGESLIFDKRHEFEWINKK